ncbi:MAG: hypothetical protein ACMV1B_09320 [Prevotella sp.]
MTSNNVILAQYTDALEGTLGAIAAYNLINSKESSKAIRDCSKLIDSMSVELRKALIESDKSLAVHNECN